MSNSLYNMMSLDLFLLSLSKSDFNTIHSKISHHTILPLMSWDIFSEANFKRSLSAKQLRDITRVKRLALKFDWQNNIDSIFYKEQFEAIIVTDVDQKILWVNDGFFEMTGFSMKEALYRTPQFLQGPNTLKKNKQSIRKKLSFNSPFKEVITNHKKNGMSYKCEVSIFPLYSNGKRTHFIALEREVA